MANIGINDLAYRHTPDSHFSYYDPPDGDVWEELIRLVDDYFESAKPGYRDGVLLVPVPADYFFTPVVTLRVGDHLAGSYDRRRDGEAPRKSQFVIRKGLRAKNRHDPAKFVNVVLYHHDVLAEDGPTATDCEWEIVTILASPVADEPMTPDTLLANHFGADGGTDTKMTAEEFETALRVSYQYWKDRALLGE